MDRIIRETILALADGAEAIAKGAATPEVMNAYAALKQLLVIQFKLPARVIATVETDPYLVRSRKEMDRLLSKAQVNDEVVEKLFEYVARLQTALRDLDDEPHFQHRSEAEYDEGLSWEEQSSELPGVFHELEDTPLSGDPSARPPLPGKGALRRIADANRKFQTGRALFNPPKTMWVGLRETIELRLAAKDVLTVKERAAIEKTMTGRGDVAEEAVSRVGAKMKAVLYAEEEYLDITAISSPEQDIDPSGTTIWDWSVRPVKPTPQTTTMTLRLTLLQDAEGQELQSDLQALRSVTRVRVKSVMAHPARIWRDHWQYVITTVVAAAGVVVAYLAIG